MTIIIRDVIIILADERAVINQLNKNEEVNNQKMRMIRWQPLPEIISLRQAMDRLLEDSFATPSRILSTTSPDLATPINMYQTDNEVIVNATLPGIKPEEVAITITGDTITIKGETKAEEKVKREDYLYQEHRYGTFNRSVTLPSGLDTDKAKADFDNGVLSLTIPKSEETKPRQIKVKAKSIAENKN
ncbi:Hsp20/alpha crystallin family protein [Chloroflexota bacterium]